MKGRCIHKIIMTTLFLVIEIVYSGYSYAQSREYLLKAGFIEKFTHFIEWPSSGNDSSETFKIAVIGQNKFGNSLEEIFSKVKIKNKVAEIFYISSIEEINDCMILFISGTMDSKLNEILDYTTGKPVLTISDNGGYGKEGVIINLLLIKDYIRYEINRETLKKSGLKMSSLLLDSAIIVKADE